MSFQGLENARRIFPRLGKTGGFFSNPWKRGAGLWAAALLALGARAGVSLLEVESDEVLLHHFPCVAHIRVEAHADTNACTQGHPPRLAVTVVQSLKGALPDKLRAVWLPRPHDIDWGVVETNPLYIRWSQQPWPPPPELSEWLVIGELQQQELLISSRCRFPCSPERLAYLKAVLAAPENERRDAAKLCARVRPARRLAEFREAVRGLEFHADIFQFNAAMQTFVGHYGDRPDTLEFLRERALDAAANEELPACLALAQLWRQDGVAQRLKTWQTASGDTPLARAARHAVAFLPTDLARKIAEDVVTQQPQKNFALLGEHLRLLRAIGDEGTVKKLAGAALPDACYTGIGRAQLDRDLRQRLALPAAVQARWQEQELALHQICLRLPGFHAPAQDFRWAAEHLVARGIRFEPDFLRYKLEQALPADTRQRDWDAGVAAPICLYWIGQQHLRDLRPVVESWTARRGEVQRISQAVLQKLALPQEKGQP